MSLFFLISRLMERKTHFNLAPLQSLFSSLTHVAFKKW